MDLLTHCLTKTYFQYNGKHYKQMPGTAMGPPVSVVVAEIVMQHLEERVLATYENTIPPWLGWIDDTFSAVHKDKIDAFHDYLNQQSADYSIVILRYQIASGVCRKHIRRSCS